jgi:hypothetical protein
MRQRGSASTEWSWAWKSTHSYLALPFRGVNFVTNTGVGLTSVDPPGRFVSGQTRVLASGVKASAGTLPIFATVLAVFRGANPGRGIGHGSGSSFAETKPDRRPKGRLGECWDYSDPGGPSSDVSSIVTLAA